MIKFSDQKNFFYNQIINLYLLLTIVFFFYKRLNLLYLNKYNFDYIYRRMYQINTEQ